MKCKSILMGVVAVISTSCDNPSGPDIIIPNGARPPEAILASLPRNGRLKVAFPNNTLVAASNDPLLSRAEAPHYVNFYCRAPGAGGFHIQISGNNHIHGLINCLPQFRPPVRRPYNLAAYFRELDGRTVTRIALAPDDLAKQVAMGASASISSERLGAGTASFGILEAITAEDVDGDIGVECEKEGEGTLTVYFSPTDTPSSESFPLECAPEHEQGSGG